MQGDLTPVKGWRLRGYSCEIRTANSPAADALGRDAFGHEVRGLEKGMSGYA